MIKLTKPTHIIYSVKDSKLNPAYINKRVHVLSDQGWGIAKAILLDRVDYTEPDGSQITEFNGCNIYVSLYDLIEADKDSV